jgi:hypothetical protein
MVPAMTAPAASLFNFMVNPLVEVEQFCCLRS